MIASGIALVTGAAGAIGAGPVRELRAAGWSALPLDLRRKQDAGSDFSEVNRSNHAQTALAVARRESFPETLRLMEGKNYTFSQANWDSQPNNFS